MTGRADASEGGDSLFADAGRPFSFRGIALAAVAAAPMLLSPIGPRGSWAILAGAATAVVHLLAVTHVARGGTGFLELTAAPKRTSAIATLGRAFALYVVAAMPFVAAVSAGAAAGEPVQAISDTDVLAAMLVTSLYLPAAIGAVVASGHGATAFWPFAWMRVIGVLGPFAYARATALFALTVTLAWAVDLVGLRATDALASHRALPVATSAVAAFLRTTAANLVWFTQACLLGAVLRRHAEDLGIRPLR